MRDFNQDGRSVALSRRRFIMFHGSCRCIVVLGLCFVVSTLAAENASGPFLTMFFLDDTDELNVPELREADLGDGSVDYSRYDEKDMQATLSMLFHEAREEDHFGGGGISPPRLTNTSWEEFAFYARRGIPVIVTDATREWPMASWTCDSIRETFGKEKMRQEYTPEGRRSVNHQTLKDASWKDKKVPLDNGPDKEKGPQFAPWYWDIKDRDDLRGSVKAAVRSQTRVPYFMENSFRNKYMSNQTVEFWFSAPGAGAKAHSDEHCDGTVSFQLSGRKEWRIGVMPAVKSYTTVNRFRDGDIDIAKWTPTYQFILNEGEGIFFPPGFLHETRNVGDNCAVSITYNWPDPPATIYMREFLPRLVLDSSVGRCSIEQWGVYPTLSADPKLPTSGQAVMKRSRKTFVRVDKNADSYVDESELNAYVSKWDKQRMAELLAIDAGAMSDADVSAAQSRLVDDIMTYQDRDADGRVSRTEFLDNNRQWAAMNLLKRRGRPIIEKYLKGYRRNRCPQKKLAHSLAVQLEQGDTESHAARALAELNDMPTDCQQLVRVARKVIKRFAVNVDRQTPSHLRFDVPWRGAVSSASHEDL